MAWCSGYRPSSSGLVQLGSAPLARARHMTGRLWAAAALYRSRLGLRLEISSSRVVSSSSWVGDSSALSSSKLDGGGTAGTSDSPNTRTSSSEGSDDVSIAFCELPLPSASDCGTDDATPESLSTPPLSWEVRLACVSDPRELTESASALAGDLSTGEDTTVVRRRAASTAASPALACRSPRCRVLLRRCILRTLQRRGMWEACSSLRVARGARSLGGVRQAIEPSRGFTKARLTYLALIQASRRLLLESAVALTAMLSSTRAS
uniref:Uncharacterized protein n=1 Tax=Ixodes ricinus TaxID=34613 RepID=A0A6B0V4Y5_IXORI